MRFRFDPLFFPERCDIWKLVPGGRDNTGGVNASYTQLASNVVCSIDDAASMDLQSLEVIGTKIDVVVGFYDKHNLTQQDIIVPYENGSPTATFINGKMTANSKAYSVVRERKTGIEDIQTYRVDCLKRT